MEETERLRNRVGRWKEKAAEAESEVRSLALEASAALRKISSRASLLEAAMRVIMKHNLLDEFASELSEPEVGTQPKRIADALNDVAAATQ